MALDTGMAITGFAVWFTGRRCDVAVRTVAGGSGGIVPGQQSHPIALSKSGCNVSQHGRLSVGTPPLDVFSTELLINSISVAGCIITKTELLLNVLFCLGHIIHVVVKKLATSQ